MITYESNWGTDISTIKQKSVIIKLKITNEMYLFYKIILYLLI